MLLPGGALQPVCLRLCRQVLERLVLRCGAEVVLAGERGVGRVEAPDLLLEEALSGGWELNALRGLD
jgi:hypothetical protein